MYSWTKRTFALVTIAALMTIGMGVSTASADQPVEDSVSFTFSDFNPCTGLPQDVTINLALRDHVGHNNSFVSHGQRTGTTSDGFVIKHAADNFVRNQNGFHNNFTDQWRHEDGSKFKAQGRFHGDDDGLRIDSFTLTCIGNGNGNGSN